MSADGLLRINHRELIVSSSKKPRFEFLRLPRDLQDQIIDGFDANTMTLHQASELIRKQGFSLTHEAIAGYYRTVRGRRADLLARTMN
jgi:hypothetical protein